MQRCCLSNITYIASNIGDATTFDNWTLPPGWTQVSQSGASITVTPNANCAGNITCRAGIPTACPPYYQTVTLAVTRNDAVITTLPSMFKENRICPGEVLQYAINPICGATDYIWQFPTGFTITGYANNKTQANVTVGNTAVSGNVTVTAVFNGCPSVNLIKVLTVLTGAPAAAPTFLTDAPNYHCDAWYVCRNGSLSIPNNLSSIGNDVLTITYTIEPHIPPATPSFYFKNSANQPVYTITHNYNFTTQSFGGPSTVFYSTNCTNSGRYSVQAGNCIGNSPKRTTRIFRESECWCLGTPPYPYAWGTPKPCLTPPTGCGSCGPVGNKPVKNPLSTMPIEEIKSNKLFPNPASGIVTVQMLEKGYKSIRVIGADGKNAYNFSTAEQQFKFNTSQWVQGMYLIEVTKGSTIILKEKLIVNKQ